MAESEFNRTVRSPHPPTDYLPVSNWFDPSYHGRPARNRPVSSPPLRPAYGPGFNLTQVVLAPWPPHVGSPRSCSPTWWVTRPPPKPTRRPPWRCATSRKNSSAPFWPHITVAWSSRPGTGSWSSSRARSRQPNARWESSDAFTNGMEKVEWCRFSYASASIWGTLSSRVATSLETPSTLRPESNRRRSPGNLRIGRRLRTGAE
jgi:hypothetical protein